jgi:methionyl-tRNA synthetase
MKEFADTVSTVLAGGIERWTDTVLDLLEQDFESVAPAPGAVSGSLDVERADLPGRIAAALGAETFSPQKAAAELAAVIDRAVDDLRQLSLLRAAGPREEYAARLAAHLELLAAVAVTSAALMPGWSAHLAGRLGVPVDLTTQMPKWDSLDGRLVPGGTQLPDAVALFFHELS